MQTNCTYLPYPDTHSFSKLVLDYLNADEKLQPFYQHPVSLEGMKKSINARRTFTTNRKVLVDELSHQYAGYELTPVQQANLLLLMQENTFTITTAHQPNIFTGHLYFIYKILHTIKLCQLLKEELPENQYVPVFYMGSEDADLDELGHINVDGEKLEWETNQTGAVGRMHTNGLEKIIERLEGEFGNLPYGEEMKRLCTEAYTKHDNIQTATLYLVNELFKNYGLLVLIPDNANLKRLFNSIVKKELTEQFSHKLVAETIAQIGEHYKVQAGGRDLNLFYLDDSGKRERIELINATFQVPNLGLIFTESAMLQELEEHPERFSANVILRGVFQEMILPNIAFIGGGGELAYWLELKKVFEAVNVPYPMLILRNSFLIIEPKQKRLMNALQLTVPQLFLGEMELQNLLTERSTKNRLKLDEEEEQVNQLYAQMQWLAAAVDPTLQPHVASLHTRSLQSIHGLEKKMLRAEKRKNTDQHKQLSNLRSAICPNNSLQERVDNFMPLYAKYGKDLIDVLYQHSLGLEGQFGIVEILAAEPHN
ncbi:MAG: bacillithiol biosynthesis cysteine-adding enzyme BshC [Bacteroidota bacterium]